MKLHWRWWNGSLAIVSFRGELVHWFNPDPVHAMIHNIRDGHGQYLIVNLLQLTQLNGDGKNLLNCIRQEWNEHGRRVCAVWPRPGRVSERVMRVISELFGPRLYESLEDAIQGCFDGKGHPDGIETPHGHRLND